MDKRSGPIPERADLAWIKKYVSIVNIAQELALEVFGKTFARCWRTENHKNGDAHPSLRFDLRKNRARCFVCDQIGGFSNIDLVMGVLRRDFPSAVDWICERFPVPSVERGSPLGRRSSWLQHYRVGVSGSELEFVIRSGLWAEFSPTQRAVLPVLCAFRDSDTGCTAISYRGLMRYAGVGSPASIARAIWHLQALHALRVHRCRGMGVVQGCSVYELTLDDPQFIHLLNTIHRRHREEIDRERAFRAGLRASRIRVTRDSESLGSCTRTAASSLSSILHVDPLCVENQPKLQSQQQGRSCTGELLSSLSEVQPNKSLHSTVAQGTNSPQIADSAPTSQLRVQEVNVAELLDGNEDDDSPQRESQIGLQSELQANMLRGQGQAANERGGSLARRRYQKGMLVPKEKHDKKGRVDRERSVWIGRWREDEVREGCVYRVRRYVVLGTFVDFPTRKLAHRELDKRISSINDPGIAHDPLQRSGNSRNAG